MTSKEDYCSDTEMYNSDTDFERVKRKCNWCNAYTRLMTGKPFCSRCHDKAYKVCKRCKRPFPNKAYFEMDVERCNSCHKKLMKERLARQAKKIEQGERDKTSQGPSQTVAPPTEKTKKIMKPECTKSLPSTSSKLPATDQQPTTSRKKESTSAKRKMTMVNLDEGDKLVMQLYMLYEDDEDASGDPTLRKRYLAFPVFPLANRAVTCRPRKIRRRKLNTTTPDTKSSDEKTDDNPADDNTEMVVIDSSDSE